MKLCHTATRPLFLIGLNAMWSQILSACKYLDAMACLRLEFNVNDMEHKTKDICWTEFGGSVYKMGAVQGFMNSPSLWWILCWFCKSDFNTQWTSWYGTTDLVLAQLAVNERQAQDSCIITHVCGWPVRYPQERYDLGTLARILMIQSHRIIYKRFLTHYRLSLQCYFLLCVVLQVEQYLFSIADKLHDMTILQAEFLVETWQSLQCLDLSNTSPSQMDLKHMCKLSCLRDLTLQGHPMDLEYICRMTKLKSLRFLDTYCSLKTHFTLRLSFLTALTSLTLAAKKSTSQVRCMSG